MAVVVCLLKLSAGCGNPVGQVRCGPVPSGHGAVVPELDDDVPASVPDSNGQIRHRCSCNLPQGVGDEPVHGPLDMLRKPLSGQLHDRDCALRMLCCAAHGAGQSLDGQGRGADPVRQFPQVRERPLGGEVGIGQPGRQSGFGLACRACPRQAERVAQSYQVSDPVGRRNAKSTPHRHYAGGGGLSHVVHGPVRPLPAQAVRPASADSAGCLMPGQAAGDEPGGNFAADTPERYLVRFYGYDKLSLECMNKGDAVTKPGKPEDVEEQLPEWLR